MLDTNQIESPTQIATCDDHCPIKKCANLIEGKWTTLVIRELAQGEKRYFEIDAALYGISAKVLSQRLKKLENMNIIQRKVFNTVPPTTSYRLTALGESFMPVLSAMAEFGEKITLG